MHPVDQDQLGHPRLDQGWRYQWEVNQAPNQTLISNHHFGSEDSWIDISSQPSSTSLCSQGNTEIATADLSLRPGARRLRLDNVQRLHSARSASATSSSQDEYEESESESDRVMSSSNEDIYQQAEDEDEKTTALDLDRQNIFTPQPNAFSHPPQTGNARSTPTPNSYFPPVSETSHSDRLPSNRMITQQTITQRSLGRNTPLASRPQPDHDAALRASLTTLLSCAAAVRPVKETKEREVAPSTRKPAQPTTLRLIPGSELDAPLRSPKPCTKRRSRESSKDRHAKKLRAVKAQPVNEEVLSPTIMTWMISAGVVLVFSAISFSAGYAWGKEVGRIEGEIAVSSSNCGSESLRAGTSLRKLRWSAATHSVRA